jgi:hypothetical protein
MRNSQIERSIYLKSRQVRCSRATRVIVSPEKGWQQRRCAPVSWNAPAGAGHHRTIESHGSGRRRKAGGQVADIDRVVVSSGLDFLESAVDHLAKGDERELRYGALHVTAAIEVLLKASSQLAREHWTLVVDDVNRARRSEYETGDFRSVTITTALQRLRNLGSPITDKEINRINAVEKLRNRVAHFALHGENPRRTEAVVAGGLDVLLHILDREFLPTADDAERELVENTLAIVRVRLGTIQGKLSFPAGILNFESSCGVCDSWGWARAGGRDCGWSGGDGCLLGEAGDRGLAGAVCLAQW